MSTIEIILPCIVRNLALFLHKYMYIVTFIISWIFFWGGGCKYYIRGHSITKRFLNIRNKNCEEDKQEKITSSHQSHKSLKGIKKKKRQTRTPGNTNPRWRQANTFPLFSFKYWCFLSWVLKLFCTNYIGSVSLKWLSKRCYLNRILDYRHLGLG